MEEGINLAFHAQVVIKRVAVKVSELRDVSLEGGASERCDNVGFDKSSASKSHKALKTLHEDDHVPVIHVFSYQHYLTFSVYPNEVGVKVAQVGLILPFCYGLW